MCACCSTNLNNADIFSRLSNCWKLCHFILKCKKAGADFWLALCSRNYLKFLSVVEFLTQCNSVADTPLLYPVIVMCSRMFNPSGADSFILGLVSLTPLLLKWVWSLERVWEKCNALPPTYFLPTLRQRRAREHHGPGIALLCVTLVCCQIE